MLLYANKTTAYLLQNDSIIAGNCRDFLNLHIQEPASLPPPYLKLVPHF